MVYVFDESLTTLEARMAGLGVDLKRHVDFGLVVVHQIDPADLPPGEFGAEVRRVAVELGGRIVLRYFENKGRLQRAISVIKKRSGMHGDITVAARRLA